ncbi:hypothetical protein [Streptomyces sp. GZWMJZ-114]|uniref:hypothetical protein n=1 Tax=Streptomyces sp. GZWMJZ-114 TaxID=2494734 RepID=UPI0010128853|nr:hypothetical protein [Streptomyces sp. GZWMJZ-114]
MSNPAAPAEQLLELAAEFRRHNDSMTHLWERAPRASAAFAEEAKTAGLLALSATRVIRMLEEEHPPNTPPIRAVRARAVQLREMALNCNRHLESASKLLAAAIPDNPLRGGENVKPLQEDEEIARVRLDLARNLTALGPSDAVAAAEIYVAERRRQGIFPLHRPPALSPSQDAALRAVARGQVATHKGYTGHGDEIPESAIGLNGAHVTIATIRSLESRSLVTREPSPFLYHSTHVFLTPDGRRGLASSFGLSRPPTTTARPSTRPTASRSATR